MRHPVGMSATKLEIETHVVTAATAFVENVVKCVQKAGLQIEELVVEPLTLTERSALGAARRILLGSFRRCASP